MRFFHDKNNIGPFDEISSYRCLGIRISSIDCSDEIIQMKINSGQGALESM